MDQCECVDNQRVVHRSSAGSKYLESLAIRKSRAIWSVGCQGIETVDDREDSRSNRNICASDAIRISVPVPILVVVSNDGHHSVGKSIADKMSAPTLACSFIFSNSAGVNGPGLLRMYSGTANLPMSCNRAAASIARISWGSVTPIFEARPKAYVWTRRMWPW